ncbi:glycosyltransferase, group 2 family protein (glycan biosynthesis) [Legionella quinlivanii]|uniref:Glycosyltransferase, group 2 family protein (Glycan biosynthesis) n=1 Tax=Legionella quinlivanii TaxID=45073 RepID=A0A0W0Y5C2_9GAMM|nr:glycosyltransferase family 2 protein [Legionella quinlivanii]KTD52187.1 glycosyltransferase, group 2 family protein (glycan biosynthesis) [Legionella quinlivanii]MCW8452451.1 glycosyltransferase family 2 protein [Legionella quinlivanii]SEF76247.1 dolichol-phosphate mannosyltransferase [Legionella quinlivanii DSM 21216]STY12314.1 glycosyltransferase, group 2 family protein (glycan biosynthesis) [Legionella quinlivanii]
MIFHNKISVIAPMYNEEAIIESFLKKTLAVLQCHFTDYEVILVDDGSTDRSLACCTPFIKSNKNIRLLAFSRNYGHEIASTAGLDHASGDYVILMDTDLQHPPELIPEMMAKAAEGYDVVCARRVNRAHEPRLKRFLAKIFYRLTSKMTGFDMQEDTGNFRLLSRKVVDSLKKMKESNRHLLMLFAYVGFKTATIPFHCPPRQGGSSKYNLKKLINLSLDSIISFSARPLRAMSVLSFLISLAMMSYAGFTLIGKLFNPSGSEGLVSILFFISILFSVLFLFLAIISEYISRILVETKNRPLYYIKQEITQETIEHGF